MSYAKEVSFQPSSPQSSGAGVESFQATPDTRLTTFSPEDSLAKAAESTRSANLVGAEGPSAHLPVNVFRSSRTQVDKDPFVATPEGRLSQQKLSPTASTFRPFGNLAIQASPHPASASVHASGHAIPQLPSTLSTDIGLSRCLALGAPGKRVVLADAEAYFTVSVELLAVSVFMTA